MNPLRLRGEGYGRFQAFDIEIPTGCVALTGPNGSGKSRLLSAIELCLFADGSRDLAPWLAPWADRLELELEFEHAGDTYRVRRGYKQGSGSRGTATLDFEIFGDIWDDAEEMQPPPLWHPLTREKTDATQALIVETLGLSRRTFGASSFLAQGDSAAFPEASSAERKSMLGEILDPRGLWPRLAELARTEAKAAESAIASDLGRMLALGETVAQLRGLEERREEVLTEEHGVQRLLDNAEEASETAQAAMQANAAAAERHKAAVQAEQSAAQERARCARDLETAKGFAEKLQPARAQLVELDARAARVPELEAKLEEQRALVEAARSARERRTTANLAASQCSLNHRAIVQTVDQLLAEQQGMQERARHLRDAVHAETCTLCHQELGVQAREATIANLLAQANVLVGKIAEQRLLLDEAAAAVTLAESDAAAIIVPEIPQVLPDVAKPLADARQAAEQRGTVATLIQSYEEHALAVDALEANLADAAGVLLQRMGETADTALGMADGQKLEHAVGEARMAVATRRRALDEAKAAVVRVEEQLGRIREATAELKVLRAATAARQGELDLLKLAERAYGRDGIPVLLVESVIPQIEAEANRILEQMPTSDGVVFTLELRTQRALKTDAEKIRETLDILVSDPDGERAYETFSGGERARLNIALRIALARLLAHRRGAESRLLAIDELEYLDELGQECLVDVIRGVAGDFDRVLVVSHSPNVRDAFDSVIEISKADGVSRIVGDREEVAA